MTNTQFKAAPIASGPDVGAAGGRGTTPRRADAEAANAHRSASDEDMGGATGPGATGPGDSGGPDEGGRSVLDEIQAVAGDLAESGQARVAERLLELGRSIDGCASAFGDDELGRLLGSFARSAAGGVEDAGRHIRDNDLGSLIGELERFLGRHPVATSATAFTAGLLAARFLRASPPEREVERETRPQRADPTVPTDHPEGSETGGGNG